MERKAAKLLLQKAAEISSRKIRETEENVIEKDGSFQPRVVSPSRSGVVTGLAHEGQAGRAFPSLPVAGQQRLFLPAYATERIFKVESCFLHLLCITELAHSEKKKKLPDRA